eukprot:7178733-Pyramimonas_sp.AAC.1
MGVTVRLRSAEDDRIGGGGGPQLLPFRLLLELVEALERAVYHAHAGSSMLPPPPPSCVPFFRANRK